MAGPRVPEVTTRPAIIGQGMEEFYRARHHDDAIAVIVARGALLDPFGFGFGIEMGSHEPHHLDGAAAMDDL